MNFSPYLLGLCFVLTVAGGARSDAPPDKAPAKSGFDDVKPIVSKYCVQCHSNAKSRGGLNLERFKDLDSVLKKERIWEKVSEYLRGGMMPPAGKPKPTSAELNKVYAWLDNEVFKVDCTSGKKDPGRVTIRRLNQRASYDQHHPRPSRRRSSARRGFTIRRRGLWL